MILLGKALRPFSKHYGKVIGHDGEPLGLEEAMERLRVLVREVRGEQLPLPAKLRDADGLSQVYFLHVAGADGWDRDGLHIELRGYAHSSEDLEERGLISESAKDKNQIIPVSPVERYENMAEELKFGRRGPLVDKLHVLLGRLEAGENVEGLFDGWRGEWDLIQEGLDYLAKTDDSVEDLAQMALRSLDSMGDEDVAAQGEQQELV
jgi:hypothetical protein